MIKLFEEYNSVDKVQYIYDYLNIAETWISELFPEINLIMNKAYSGQHFT